MTLHVSQKLINVLEVLMGIRVAEIPTPRLKQSAASVVIANCLKVLIYILGNLIYVIALKSGIVLDRNSIAIPNIKAVVQRRPIVIVKYIGINQVFISLGCLWLPDYLHFFCIKTVQPVLVVNTGEELSIEAHFCLE